MPLRLVPVILPELMTLAPPAWTIIPVAPLMLAPALLVTVALVPAKMPALRVPMMLPELVILAMLAVIPKLALLIVPELTTLASAVVAIPASPPRCRQKRRNYRCHGLCRNW